MAVPMLRLLLRRSFLPQLPAQARCVSSLRKTQVSNQALLALVCPCSFYCTQVLYRNEVTVRFQDGLPVISVPLPSRRESCDFTMKPVSHTLGNLMEFIRQEDGGIDRVAVYKEDGSRVAQSTPIEVLLRGQFTMYLNDQHYIVCPPETRGLLSEDAQSLSDIKQLVSELYSTLSVEDHQLRREAEILRHLENLKTEIAPLEKVKQQLELQASSNTNHLAWLGLGLMGLQFGVLARLTWWEYSWDIMEPVTYFVTYGTSMALFAYYILTKQEYIFPDVHDRQFLIRFYKLAQKNRLNMDHYNRLRDDISQAEEDLQRLRDPLQMHLPIKEMQKRAEEDQ